MKIILFTDNLGAGGAQRQLVGLAKLLKEKGHCVNVALYNTSNFFASELDDADIRYVVVKHSKNRVLRIPLMLQYFRKESPDWIIAYQATPSLIASLTKIAFPRIKVLVSERTTTQVLHLKDRVRFWLYRYVDSIVPNSYTQSNFIKNLYSNISSKISTIPNFIDLNYFKRDRNVKTVIPKIIIAATIYETKNTLRFINAIRILKTKKLKFKVEWFGINNNMTSTYVNECLSKIDEFDLHDCLELKPKTTNIKAEYNKADFFCLPSLFEGTPNVICEAMACGLPIICSNVCDNYRFVKDNVNGFLFNPLDPDDIARAIEDCLLMDNEDYLRYCKNSRRIAEEMCSSKEFIEKYLTILDNKQKLQS